MWLKYKIEHLLCHFLRTSKCWTVTEQSSVEMETYISLQAFWEAL